MLDYWKETLMTGWQPIEITLTNDHEFSTSIGGWMRLIYRHEEYIC